MSVPNEAIAPPSTPLATRRGLGSRLLTLSVKLLITCALVGWLLSRIELGELAGKLEGSLNIWLVAATLVGAVNVTLVAVRWQLVLGALGASFPLGEAVRLNWAGLFFNTFLPASVVGDALRGVWAARLSDPARVFWSLLLDRVIAFAALVLLASAALALTTASSLPVAPAIAWGCLLLGVPALIVVASPDYFARLVARLGGQRLRRVLTGRITEARAVGPRFRVLLLACAVHLVVVLDVALIAWAAEIAVPWSVLLAIVPVMLAASYIPVSISGIGVRDVALVELLGQAGVPAASALTISVLIVGVSVVLGLVGGLVYLVSGGQPRLVPPPPAKGPG